jgi:hypothetical protein
LALAAQNLEENDTPTPVTDASTIRIVVEEARHIARNGDPDGRLERLRGLYPWLNYVQLPRREFPDPLQLTIDDLLATRPDSRQLAIKGAETKGPAVPSNGQEKPYQRKDRANHRASGARGPKYGLQPRAKRKSKTGASR